MSRVRLLACGLITLYGSWAAANIWNNRTELSKMDYYLLAHGH